VLGAEWPVVLPGAKGLLFRVRRQGQGVADFEIVAMELPKGKPHVLMRGLYARYSESGDLAVVSSEGKLLIAPFNAKTLELTGPPVALYEGLESNAYSCGVALSKAGTLIYMTLSQSSARELVWVTRDGAASPVDQSWKVGGTITNFSLSPNGRSIALDVLRAAGADVWVKQIPGGPFSRITFGDTAAFRPTWMPDGGSVMYLLDRGDGGGVPAVRRADGVGAQRRLLPPKYANGQAFASADGKWLIVRSVLAEAGNGDILAAHIGDSVLTPLVATSAREVTPALSPDGKFLAYASDESGTNEVFVRPFPDVATARWQVSTSGGSAPLWSHSGKELFFRNGHNDLQVAQVSESPTFTVGAQKPLFPLAPFTFGGPAQQYAISPDDKRFLMLRETAAGELGTLIVSEHWFEELKARAQK
jgi:Tol biopolymer transport system component